MTRRHRGESLRIGGTTIVVGGPSGGGDEASVKALESIGWCRDCERAFIRSAHGATGSKCSACVRDHDERSESDLYATYLRLKKARPAATAKQRERIDDEIAQLEREGMGD